jgi:hypothetical protein
LKRLIATKAGSAVHNMVSDTKTWTRVLAGVTAALFLSGAATIVPFDSVVAGASASVNTFTLSGHYHGTLKMTDPATDCLIRIDQTRISVFLTLHGKISGLISKKMTFSDFEPKNGKYTQNKATPNGGPIGFDTDTSTGIGDLSGTEVFGTTTGSVHLKVESNGIDMTTADFVHKKFTMTGSWSCPASSEGS